jgi:hypothetical protein
MTLLSFHISYAGEFSAYMKKARPRVSDLEV